MHEGDLMKIELKFAELQTPLFLAGTNFGVKLDCSKRAGMKLVYDQAEKELHVHHKDALAIIPTSNVASMTPIVHGGEKRTETLVVTQPPVLTKGRIKAQVSTPTSHVFDEKI